MAVRTIQQIQKELAVGDKSQRALINKQLQELPKLFQGQVKGLEAKQKNAFADILSGAKQRGLKFSGIPLAEQAEYTSDVFLPALAGLEEQRNTARTGLQGALADIIAQRSAMAQQIRQQELDRQFQAQQAAAARAAAAAPSFWGGGGGGGGGGGDMAMPQAIQRKDKASGWDFKDELGNPISAAQYLIGTTPQGQEPDFRGLLMRMAEAGDVGAKMVLPMVGNDLGYNQNYLQSVAQTDPNMARLMAERYNSLIWGIPGVNQIDVNQFRRGTTSRPRQQANNQFIQNNPLMPRGVGF